MNFRKVISFLCVLTLIFSITACTDDGDKDKKTRNSNAKVNTPRNETLFMSGLQWGPPANFNLLSGNPAWPIAQGRELIYETLFMYNQLDGKLEPLLAKSYEWKDDYTIIIKMNPDAHFNDGKKLTSEDVVYTYELGKKYKDQLNWSNHWNYLDSITTIDDETVEMKVNKENYNRLTVTDTLQNTCILPKHIWTKIEEKHNYDLEKIRKEFNKDPVASGPYKIHYYDDTRIIVKRDDNYWGQKLFGKLPAPKYIGHIIYKSNDIGNTALKNGDVDLSQNFIPQVWKYIEKNNVKTFLKDSPYYLPGVIPSLFINTHNKNALEVFEVRKALAMSINYEKIGEIAMSGYTDKIKPSLALNVETEMKYLDESKIKDLQWSYDVEGAKKLLDKIGAKPGKDGIRILDGKRLGPYNIECPYGWTDWNASIQIVIESAKKIGIELKESFPESPVWMNNKQTGKFDILMDSPGGSLQPSQPIYRANQIMYSVGVPKIGETAYFNWGRFKDEKADELIIAFGKEKDEEKKKEIYTELNQIYLKNIPTIPLMYRPWWFYTVSEEVWKNFPVESDGSNIPPQNCMEGAGVKALYQIEPAK
ncbi:MAG: ABC transporter substrate-binding protein [Clostridiales bacterium]